MHERKHSCSRSHVLRAFLPACLARPNRAYTRTYIYIYIYIYLYIYPLRCRSHAPLGREFSARKEFNLYGEDLGIYRCPRCFYGDRRTSHSCSLWLSTSRLNTSRGSSRGTCVFHPTLGFSVCLSVCLSVFICFVQSPYIYHTLYYDFPPLRYAASDGLQAVIWHTFLVPIKNSCKLIGASQQTL